MKSRAPSGVGLKRIGVSISRKPPSSIVRLIAETIVPRRPINRCIFGRPRSTPRHARPAGVGPAVAQAQGLVDSLLVELEGKRRRRGDDLERVDLELDLAGRD